MTNKTDPSYKNMILTKEKINHFRTQFSNMTNFSNFQWGGYSSKPKEVIQEVKRWLDIIGECPANPTIHESIISIVEELRRDIARELNAEPGEITITENTTIGHNIIGWGLDLKEGDAIIISKHEHPANILPWYNIGKRKNAEILFIEESFKVEEIINQLKEYIQNKDIKIVSLTHVSRHTGFRMPIEEIASLCNENNIFFLVDGAQSFGAIPIDVKKLNCDGYSFCGHKWWLGPQGTGGLYVKKEWIDRVEPSWVGSKSQEGYDFDGNFTWKNDMRRHEYGTKNFSLFAGWKKAIELFREYNVKTIYNTIKTTTQKFKSEIINLDPSLLVTPMDWENSSSIITIKMKGKNAGHFCERLWKEKKILCSRLDNQEMFRICNHFVNTDKERNELLAFIEDFVSMKDD